MDALQLTEEKDVPYSYISTNSVTIYVCDQDGHTAMFFVAFKYFVEYRDSRTETETGRGEAGSKKSSPLRPLVSIPLIEMP
jgi:hypothetical protein